MWTGKFVISGDNSNRMLKTSRDPHDCIVLPGGYKLDTLVIPVDSTNRFAEDTKVSQSGGVHSGCVHKLACWLGWKLSV